MLAIPGLYVFHLIGRRTRVPILNRDLVGRAVDRDPEIVYLATQHEIQGIDRRAEERPVLVPWERIGVDDRVLAIASRENCRDRCQNRLSGHHCRQQPRPIARGW